MKTIIYSILTALVLIALSFAIHKCNPNKPIIKTERHTDTIYVKGKETIVIKWHTNNIHDTTIVPDTVSFGLSCNFDFKADSCVTTGHLDYIDSLGLFSFTKLSTTYPIVKIKQIDTLKIKDSITVTKEIFPLTKKLEYTGYGIVGGFLLNSLIK